MRALFFVSAGLFSLIGCSPKYNVLGLDTDLPEEEVVDYEGATLRIVSPLSGGFVPYGDLSNFEAELLDSAGDPLEFDSVNWSSSKDTAWDPTGLVFEDDTLDVGIHNLTAQVSLPNGDRLAYSVGGVLVQSIWAGTYVGTFIAHVQYNELPLGCAGAAVLMIDPYGETLTGDSDCVVAMGGLDFDLSFVFDVAHDGEGELQGTVAANIFGFLEVDFDADGDIDLPEENVKVEFAGSTFGDMEIDGTVSANRISLDAGL
jgi:hypothetical protein